MKVKGISEELNFCWSKTEKRSLLGFFSFFFFFFKYYPTGSWEKSRDLKLEKIFVQVDKVDNYIQLQKFQEFQKYINILEENSRKMTK